jgi:hypothetical protein
MPKFFKGKLINAAYNDGWFKGYSEGVGTGLIEAILLLEGQQSKNGGIADVKKLVKLLQDNLAKTVKDYRDNS